jgi:hypothetical protein
MIASSIDFSFRQSTLEGAITFAILVAVLISFVCWFLLKGKK